MIFKFIFVIFTLFSNIIWAENLKYSTALFVGDSHSYGAFGQEIDKILRQYADKVVSVASCGASASTWLEKSDNFKSTNCGYWKKTSPQKEIRTASHQLNSLKSEISELKPQVTVIALGTNMLGDVQGFHSELKAVDKLIQQVQQAGSRCLWIGPPDVSKNPFKKNLDELNLELKKYVEKRNCTYLSSTGLTKYNFTKSDGIHYPPMESKRWGEQISAQIRSLLDSGVVSQPKKGPAGHPTTFSR